MKPFAKRILCTEIHHELLGGEVSVARPAVFLTVGTVGREIKHICKVAPERCVLKPVDKLIGAVEAADLRNVGVHYNVSEQIFCCLLVVNTCNKAVLEAVVAEHRLPDFLALAVADINLNLRHADWLKFADIVHIKSAVKETFAAGHDDFLTLSASDFQSHNTGNIFAEIIYVAVVAVFLLGKNVLGEILSRVSDCRNMSLIEFNGLDLTDLLN